MPTFGKKDKENLKDLEDFVEELNKIPILTAMQTNIIRTKVIRILSERRRKEREGKTESEVKKFVNNFTNTSSAEIQKGKL